MPQLACQIATDHLTTSGRKPRLREHSATTARIRGDRLFSPDRDHGEALDERRAVGLDGHAVAFVTGTTTVSARSIAHPLSSS